MSSDWCVRQLPGIGETLEALECAYEVCGDFRAHAESLEKQSCLSGVPPSLIAEVLQRVKAICAHDDELQRQLSKLRCQMRYAPVMADAPAPEEMDLDFGPKVVRVVAEEIGIFCRLDLIKLGADCLQRLKAITTAFAELSNVLADYRESGDDEWQTFVSDTENAAEYFQDLLERYELLLAELRKHEDNADEALLRGEL